MGEVYRASDESLQRDVALKILPPALVRSEERLRRFGLEARSASSLNHPNIVTIYEIGEDRVRPGQGHLGEPTAVGAVIAADDASPSVQPVHFISMELIEGVTLGTKIHGEDAPLDALLGWLAQAAEGLAKAHAAGIVHRDLKPGNLMVTHDGYAKVLDFGLAKLAERQAAEADRSSAPTMTEESTSEGVVLGTAGYMSPEQVQGKSVDHRSDIFSFGCILYEAATRSQPFAAESSVETMHRILHDTPAPVEGVNAKAPAELRRLIRRCLAKDPHQRLDSMKALAIELREIVDEYAALSAAAASSGVRPLSAASGDSAAASSDRQGTASTSSGSRSGSDARADMAASPASGRSARTVVSIATGVAVVVIAATLTGVWLMRRDGGRQANAPFQSMKITTLPGRGDVSSAALSPDGRYLASVSGPHERRSVWVRQVSTGSDVEIFHGTAALGGLTFAPDGEHVFYLARDPEIPVQNALYEIPVLGGTPVKRASNVNTGVTFAPDGKRVGFVRNWPDKKRQELIVLDLVSHQERILSAIQTPQFLTSDPAWSPDGERIAAAEATASGKVEWAVAVFSARDGRREVVPIDSTLFLTSLVWLPDGSGLVISAGRLPNGHRELWYLPYPRGAARRITNDPTDYSSLSISSDGMSLAAIRAVSINNLWTADARAGSTLRQLTSATAQENAPTNCTMGPDGSVVFMSNDSAHRLWRVGMDGSAPVPLATEGTITMFLYVLPDRGIVYGRLGDDGVTHIWRADPDGGNPRQVTTGVGEVLMGHSADGQTALYWPSNAANLRELWAVSIDGGEPTRLVASYPQDFFPVCSPDGSLIAYADRRDVGGKPQEIWKVIPSGGGDPIASLTLGAHAARPTASHDVKWTADGEALTFLDEVEGVENVYRQPLKGGQPQPVTRFTEGQIRGHEWSPNGRKLLLVRGNGQVDNIWLTGADGRDAVQVTDFKTGRIAGMDWVPPDGRRIVFLYGQDNSDVVLIKNFQ